MRAAYRDWSDEVIGMRLRAIGRQMGELEDERARLVRELNRRRTEAATAKRNLERV